MYEMQRKLTWSGLKSGIVVTLALVILFGTVFFSGNILSIFNKKVLVSAKITDVQGLRTGAPVWIHGVEVGSVESIKIQKHGTVILLSIVQDALEYLHKDAKAKVMTMGLLGDKFIELFTGTINEPLFSLNDTLSGEDVPEISEIVQSGMTSFEKADTLILLLTQFAKAINNGSGTLDRFINDPALYDDIINAANSITKSTSKLTNANGSLKEFLENPELYNNLNQATTKMQTILDQIAMESSSKTNGSTDTSVLLDIKSAVVSLKALIEDIQKNPKRYFQISVF